MDSGAAACGPDLPLWNGRGLTEYAGGLFPAAGQRRALLGGFATLHVETQLFHDGS